MTADHGGLRALARDHGVQLSYVGTDGSRARATTRQLRSVLALLGYEGITDASATLLVEERRRARATLLVEPVVVVSTAPALVPVKGADGMTVDIALHREDGNLEEWSAAVTASSLLIGDLPVGRHQLELSVGGRRATSTILRSPGRLPGANRAWGVSAPLYALWHATGPGPVFADLGVLGQVAARHGGSLVGTLPLLALPSGRAEPPSPYAPSSRRAWDITFLDARQVLARFDSPSLRQEIDRWEKASRAANGRFVDHLARCDAVWRVLDEAAALLPAHVAAAHEVRHLLEADQVLAQFCRFEARSRLGVDLDIAVMASAIGQLLCREQLTELTARCDLYLDLPVGVHPAGFDASSTASSFVSGASIGAPPDDLFEGGQSWGCPPPHPEGSRATGYALLSQSLRHVLSVAKVIRIDHVMGLARLYWVPDGCAATDGVYVHSALDELIAVVAIEAARAGAVVVGEDLGTLPQGLHAALRHAGLLSSQVFQFEDVPVPRRAGLALASLGTHDLMPFAAYLEGRDIDELESRGFPGGGVEARRRERAGRRASLGVAADGPLDRQSLRRALCGSLRQLVDAEPSLLMMDCEDLLYEREPQNRPGTPIGDGNFSRRTAVPLDSIESDPELGGILDEVGAMRSSP